MPTTPDLHRYIHVQFAGGAAVTNTETTIRQSGRVLIQEAPCPVLTDTQRAALYERAAEDARAAGVTDRSALRYRVSPDWDFEFVGAEDPGLHPSGNDSAMLVSVYAGASGGVLSRFDVPDYGPRADGTHVSPQMGFGVGSDAAIGAFLGTITTSGDDRGEALRAMKYALDEIVTDGVETNIPLLSVVLSSDEFMRGDFDAGFIDREFPDGFQGVTLGKGHARHIAAVCGYLDKTARSMTGDTRYSVSVDEHDFTVQLSDEPGLTLAAVDEDSDKATVEVELKSDWKPGERVVKIYIDDRLMIVQARETADGYAVYYRGANLAVEVEAIA